MTSPPRDLNAAQELTTSEQWALRWPVIETCPLCGETGFDTPGWVYHVNQYCAVAAEALEAQHDSLESSRQRHFERVALRNQLNERNG